MALANWLKVCFEIYRCTIRAERTHQSSNVCSECLVQKKQETQNCKGSCDQPLPTIPCMIYPDFLFKYIAQYRRFDIDRLSPCGLQVYQDHTLLRRACSPAGPALCPYCPRRWAIPLEGHLGWACLDLCLTSGPFQSYVETAAPSGSQRRCFLVGPDRGSETTLEVAGEKYKHIFKKIKICYINHLNYFYLFQYIKIQH